MGLTRGCSAPASNTEPLAWLVPPAQTFGAGHGVAAQAWPQNPPIPYCSPWLSRYLRCSLGSAAHKLLAPPSTSGSNEMPPAPLEPGAHLTIRNTEGIWVISRGSVTPPPPLRLGPRNLPGRERRPRQRRTRWMSGRGPGSPAPPCPGPAGCPPARSRLPPAAGRGGSAQPGPADTASLRRALGPRPRADPLTRSLPPHGLTAAKAPPGEPRAGPSPPPPRGAPAPSPAAPLTRRFPGLPPPLGSGLGCCARRRRRVRSALTGRGLGRSQRGGRGRGAGAKREGRGRDRGAPRKVPGGGARGPGQVPEQPPPLRGPFPAIAVPAPLARLGLGRPPGTHPRLPGHRRDGTGPSG